MKREINIVIDNNFFRSRPDEENKSFINLLFNNEGIEYLDNKKDFLDILIEYNFFPSRNQAFKNGFKKEIPKGYNEFIIGKLKRKIFLYNDFINWKEFLKEQEELDKEDGNQEEYLKILKKIKKKYE